MFESTVNLDTGHFQIQKEEEGRLAGGALPLFDDSDSLLSIVQMPSGIPVATVAIGRTGAKNAAILALQILGLSDPRIENALGRLKESLAEGVREKNRKIGACGG